MKEATKKNGGGATGHVWPREDAREWRSYTEAECEYKYAFENEVEFKRKSKLELDEWEACAGERDDVGRGSEEEKEEEESV